MPYRWLQIALAALTGIEPGEVLQALCAEHRLPVPATSHGIPLLVIIAPTRAGRILAVTTRQDEGFDWLIVGARDASDEQGKLYEHWRTQR